MLDQSADVLTSRSFCRRSLEVERTRYLRPEPSTVGPINRRVDRDHFGQTGLSDLRRILWADFGIARQANEASGLTATNMTAGSDLSGPQPRVRSSMSVWPVLPVRDGVVDLGVVAADGAQV